MLDSTVVTEKIKLRQKILGVKIRHARTRAGLGLKEVARVLELSTDRVSDIEYGRRDISLPQLEMLALLFNIPLTYFWADDIIQEPNFNFPAQQAIALRQRIIGVLLRQARTKAGRTQEELAKLLDVSPATISRYEFGQTEIPLAHLEAMTDYLNVSLNYFMDTGIAPNQSINGAPTLDEIADYSRLPQDVREFLANPANLLYINIAMKLSEVSADTLRALAEGLLEVTY